MMINYLTINFSDTPFYCQEDREQIGVALQRVVLIN